jgi:hypothetical protein
VSLFRRRRNSEPDQVEEAVEAVETPASARSTEGPWDATDAPDDDVARLDLGALQVPTLPDVEVRVEADQSGDIAAVLLVHGDSGVQLGAFAAPRSEGIWPEVRTEIGQGIVADGGSILEEPGEFGTELLAKVKTPDGPQPVRFVGVDGPRWFLRAVFTGAAAADPSAGNVLTESLRQVVVVRGGDPMPVRDPLPLRLPREVIEQQAEPEQKPVLPPKRGPEITEVR